MPRPSALQQAAARTTPGTAQHERAPDALQPGWFNADERTLADWVALLAAQARHLRLPALGPAHNPALRPAGLAAGNPETPLPAPAGSAADTRWSGLFERDEALLLACIASERGDSTAAAMRVGDDSASPWALQAELQRLSALLQAWQLQLQRCEGAGALALLGTLKALQQDRLRPERDDLEQRLPAGADPLRLPDAAAVHAALRRAVALHRAALGRLRERARELLPPSMRSGSHDAAAALLLAAAQVAGTTQRHANSFSARLVDFHVDEVLGLKPRAARPDRLFALASREPGAPFDAIVPAGTAFTAGRDAEGRDIVYRSLDTRRIDATEVVALHTLHLKRDALISPEHELGYVCRARCQSPALPDVAALAATAAEGAGGAAPLPVWPLFGGDELAAPNAATDACFGLAVASPLLLLEEGERRLQLTLRLSHIATADMRLRALAAQHAAELARADPQAAATLAALFRAYAQLERRRPAQGLPSVAQLVAEATPRLLALPPEARSALQHYRCFLLLRTLRANGAGFRFAAGRLFVHWLLAPVGLPAGLSTENGGDAASDWLLGNPADRAALHAAARAALPEAVARATRDGGATLADDPLGLFLLDGSARHPPERELIVAQLLGGLFAVQASGPQGWFAVPQAHLLRPPQQPADGVDLQLVLRLSASDPPLLPLDPALHGSGWDTALPVLQLRLRASGGLYPYSMLESAQLLDVQLQVQVAGLRRITLHNQIGPLDPGKPFQPFGPLPAVGQGLVLGARELACKPVTALSLHLRWSGLPAGGAGFAGHYAGWPDPPDDARFRVTPEVLRDAQWVAASMAMPASAGAAAAASGAASASARAAAASVPLFASAGPDQGLAGSSHIAFDARLLRDHHQPLDGPLPEAAPAFDVASRRALFRLRLTHPAAAFGHADYAHVLTTTVQANARRRLGTPAPLPRAPYTPTLEGITLDYSAAAGIHLGAHTGTADAHTPRVYHLHPFGVDCVHPQPRASLTRLLPPVLHDGTLFVGLRAPQPPQRVALLFHLHDASAVPGSTPPPTPRWHALRGDRWQRLDAAQVLQDGTAGFLSSGIVELELPEGVDTTHRIMPDGLYWLALGVDGGFSRFAGLHGVHAQALCLQRELPGTAAPAPGAAPAAAAAPSSGAARQTLTPHAALQPLPPGAALRALRPVPALAGLQRLGPATGLAAAETPSQLRVRVGERLRHRQRACLPWDYERLLLAQFPDVGQAKCFGAQALVAALGPAARGSVMLAVLPAAHRYDPAGGVLAPRMNAAELALMQTALQDLAPAGVRVRVRNAAYERVQVRCRVRLQADAAEGAVLRACEQALFELLCPWLPGALPPRFGWALRGETVESRLRTVPGVAFVTGLSLLQLARDDSGYHHLADSARRRSGRTAEGIADAGEGTDADADAGTGSGRTELRPAVPWGIAVPMATHLITPTRNALGLPAVATGIADLSVGRNFVIGRNHG